jgi:flavin reductase (DIM6/NTAB) family NADH-FMN oxidoreductase RutF
MNIDPASLSTADRYKLMIGSIVPRPIAWVSTISPNNIPNLAPFSFFCGIGANPMTLAFCPANTPQGTPKDTLRNCLEPDAQCVVNIVSHAHVREMSQTSADLPYEVSEFDAVGLTPAQSTLVRPPRVAESLISFECKVLQVLRLGADQPSGSNMVIAQVVMVHADPRVINDRNHIDPAVLDAVGRMGGDIYTTTRDRFVLPRQ